MPFHPKVYGENVVSALRSCRKMRPAGGESNGSEGTDDEIWVEAERCGKTIRHQPISRKLVQQKDEVVGNRSGI